MADGGWALTGGWGAVTHWAIIAQAKPAPLEGPDFGTQMRLLEKWPIKLAAKIVEKKSANKKKKKKGNKKKKKFKCSSLEE